MLRAFTVSILIPTLSLALVTGCSGDATKKADDKQADAKPADDKKADDKKAEEQKPGDDKPTGDKPVAINVDDKGQAMHGYDPVQYFETGKAETGKAEFSHTWENATWLFASAENRDKFAASPERFAPKNGGYCTFGVVLSKKFDGDPKVYLLEQDQLFLFLNEEVKEKFLQDKAGNLTKVGTNWPSIKDKSPAELDS